MSAPESARGATDQWEVFYSLTPDGPMEWRATEYAASAAEVERLICTAYTDEETPLGTYELRQGEAVKHRFQKTAFAPEDDWS